MVELVGRHGEGGRRSRSTHVGVDGGVLRWLVTVVADTMWNHGELTKGKVQRFDRRRRQRGEM